jgi:hypothetical protein
MVSVTELDALLEKASKVGFIAQMFHPGHGPDVLAIVYQWESCADVAVLFDDQHAQAYRMPTADDADMFAPTHVYWWYGASAVWTLRALLTLPAPGQPDAPHTLVPAPSGLPHDRMSARMRPR